MRTRALGWGTMTLLASLVVLVSLHYLALDPSTYFEEQRDVYVRREHVLLAHVGGAMLALLVGPWQFSRRLRAGSLRLHRTFGITYAVATTVGGTAGILLATTALGGIITSVGFMGLGISWLATTWLGVRAIFSGDRTGHRRWMIRSFALCFAAVTLRLYLGVFGGLESAGWVGSLTFTQAYTAIAWLCWVPNLAIGWRMSAERSADVS